MPHAKCHHCGTEIVDHTSMVERRGELYCCVSCAEAVVDTGAALTADSCAHCGTAIVDPRVEIVRGGQTFCCPNCAAAVPASAEQPA